MKKILVVEDEPGIADNITYALSTEGFLPVWSATGREAFRSLDESIALVIVDIGLPDINGFDLIREIRRKSSVPLIVVTARSGEVDRIVGLELGADDYVSKPFSPRELTARVRAVLRRYPGPPGGAQNGSPFFLDEKRCLITFHGQRLELSRYEFRLLSVLIGNPGRVYTRDELMARAWEEPEMSLDRTVDTHIKSIRQKLKAVRPEDDSIITHRGIGYSLRDGQ